MKIDEKAIWKWIGFRKFEGWWQYTNEKGGLIYAEVNLPNLRSLDVQKEYLWPKLYDRYFTVHYNRFAKLWVCELGIDKPFAEAEHKELAQAILLAVMELIK